MENQNNVCSFVGRHAFPCIHFLSKSIVSTKCYKLSVNMFCISSQHARKNVFLDRGSFNNPDYGKTWGKHPRLLQATDSFTEKSWVSHILWWYGSIFLLLWFWQHAAWLERLQKHFFSIDVDITFFSLTVGEYKYCMCGR